MVLVSAIGVLSLSYVVAQTLSFAFLKGSDYKSQALTVAATFPNIVALPILIFPSLCEHEVVYANFVDHQGSDEEQIAKCADQATTMIFIYFFGWSLLFWSFGHPKLMAAAKASKEATSIEEASAENPPTEESTPESTGEDDESPATCLSHVRKAIIQTTTSPGFLTMVVGLACGMIPGLSDALFSAGGPLRFLGDAIETMGIASSPLSTMIVAASLMAGPLSTPSTTRAIEENPIMSDPTFGPRRSSLRRLSQRLSLSLGSSDGSYYRLLLWFVSSRLVLSPALIVSILYGLNQVYTIPPLVSLVVSINSSLPGANIIVVLLLSSNSPTAAAVVTQVYLPVYVLSIVSIAAWTALGLYLFLPED